MKNFCLRLSGLGALFICIPVIYRISKGDIFNPASFFLWGLLSLVCAVVLIRAKKGGHILVIGYFFSDLLIASYAYIKSGKASFGNFEWLIIILTCICAGLYAWCEFRGDFKPAVITNATACMVAGIPQIVDSFRKPYQMSLVICGIYTLISVLNYYGEQPNLNGRLLPGLSILYWIVIIGGVIIARSFLPQAV